LAASFTAWPPAHNGCVWRKYLRDLIIPAHKSFTLDSYDLSSLSSKIALHFIIGLEVSLTTTLYGIAFRQRKFLWVIIAPYDI